MEYLIEGADKTTGQDRTVIVSADGEQDLRAKIAAMGILVSHAKPWKSPVAPPVAIPYATPTTPPVATPVLPRVPRYFGLQLASAVLGISALLFYGLTVFNFITAISSGPARNSPFGFAGAAAQIISCVMLLAAGGIQHGLSAACSALRDIARNSFPK